MSVEQELKLKVDEFKSIKSRLATAKAIRIGSFSQTDIYYGNEHLIKALGRSFLIRIRESGKKHMLAFKGATGKVGSYEEYETHINDAAAASNMFEKSGFEHIITVRKKRESYKYKDSTINLDSVEGLGKFVEIEIISDKPAKNKLNEIVRELGFGTYPKAPMGYVSLMLARDGSKYSKYVKE